MQESPKTIVFGKNGFLGSHLFQHFQKNPNYYFGYRSNENKLVIQNSIHPTRNIPWSYEALATEIHDLQPEVVINAIALANAEQCERSPSIAEQANSEIPKVLAIASCDVDARIVHVSTDAVFGQEGSFFREDHEPHPKSIYGRTKLQGELGVIKHAPKHLIVRTNFYGYHKTKPTLFNYFYQNLRLRHRVDGYENVVFNPVYIKDLVFGIETFIQRGIQGILHFAGDEVLSKFDFGNKIAIQLSQQNGTLSNQVFRKLETVSYRKLDLTLSSGSRESLYNCIFDINSGIQDAILSAKADEHEL
jgi:dTDP-4-dehydrorhamnose reductase